MRHRYTFGTGQPGTRGRQTLPIPIMALSKTRTDNARGSIIIYFFHQKFVTPFVWPYEGRNQIGEDQARSWIVFGKSERGATPARMASQVDQRQEGFSSART